MHDYVVCAHLCVTCVNEAFWINVDRATRDKPGPVGVRTMFFAIAMVLWWLCFLSMLDAWSTMRQSCWQSKEHFACLSPLLNQPCGRKRIGVHYRLGVFFSFAPLEISVLSQWDYGCLLLLVWSSSMWIDQLMVLQMYWLSKGWIDPCLSWLLLRSFFLVRLFFLCRGYNFFILALLPLFGLYLVLVYYFSSLMKCFCYPKKKKRVNEVWKCCANEVLFSESYIPAEVVNNNICKQGKGVTTDAIGRLPSTSCGIESLQPHFFAHF